jgi:hypothetical protein
VAVPATPDDQLRSDLRAAFDEIGKDNWQPLFVGLGSFTYEYEPYGGAFSNYLQDFVADAIAESDSFRLASLAALDNLDPSFREIYSELFTAEQIDGVVNGRYFEQDGRVEVRIEVVSLRTAAAVGRARISVRRSAIPARYSLKPDNATIAAERARELLNVGDGAAADSEASGTQTVTEADGGSAQDDGEPGPFRIEITTSRGDGGVYHDGENLLVQFFSSRPAFVKLYHIDVNGNTQLIFPNQFQRNNHIPAFEMVRIPRPRDPFAFRLGAPYGTEYIKVVASTAQFEDIEDSFRRLSGDPRSIVRRGMASRDDGEIREAIVAYTIVRK